MKRITVLSTVLCAVPLYFFILWLYCFSQAETQTARKDLFDSMVPEFLSGRYDTIYLGVFCGLCAIVISTMIVAQTTKIWRVLNTFVIILSLFLLVFNLMSLM